MLGYQVVVTNPGKVGIESFAISEPQAGEVQLRALTTLVSPGTERAFYLNLENTNSAYPFIPGYSYVGEVIAVGESVDTLAVGDRVICPAQHKSHVVMPAKVCLKIPDNVSDEDASFFNLLAIAMQGVRKTRIELGESVVVLGAGIIGMFAMRLAQLAGGLPVIGVDLDPQRLEIAKIIGADETLVSDVHLQQTIRDVLGTDGANVVLELTGVPSVVVTAFQAAGFKGRVALVGSTRGDTESINFYRDVHRKGLTVIGSHEITRPQYENSPGYWTQIREHRVCLELLARGRVQTQPLITHRYNWREFTKAYEHLSNRDTSALGMVIHWD
jgi:2-desacetyl-2-hydroxyethyl bacteriochlorophyllide A dehydrogenase